MSSHRAEIDIQPFWLPTTFISPGSPWPPFFSPVGFRTTIYFSRGENHLPKGTSIFKKMVATTSQVSKIARIEEWITRVEYN